MNILIAGTGYVGLTTGVALAYFGHDVTCLDPDEAKIGQLKRGILPIYEPGLQELLRLSESKLTFVSNYDDVNFSNVEVIFIAVGTPAHEDGSSDLSQLSSAARSIGDRLDNRFTVVVTKSTVPIGSGNWVEAIIRESYEARNGRTSDGHFVVASNPEFLREGSALHDTFFPDRVVVGADDPRAPEILTEVYRPILTQEFTPPEFLPRPAGMNQVPIVTTDIASAELVKYAANAFLALKISYINEIAQLAERVGADIQQIGHGIGLDPRIGSRFLNAGIGWGGSCFGKDTSALVSTAAEYGLAMPIVEAARSVNYQLRGWIVDRLLSELRVLKGRRICLLGLAFKPHTDDIRDAPALDIAQKLAQLGAGVHAYDPVAAARASREHPDLPLTYFEDPLAAVRDVDAIVLATEWPEFLDMPWKKVKRIVRMPLVVDGRNFLDQRELELLGFRYVAVGRGSRPDAIRATPSGPALAAQRSTDGSRAMFTK